MDNEEEDIRVCFICGKQFDGYITPLNAIEEFKKKYGYMPNEDGYVEICKTCSEDD